MVLGFVARGWWWWFSTDRPCGGTRGDEDFGDDGADSSEPKQGIDMCQLGIGLYGWMNGWCRSRGPRIVRGRVRTEVIRTTIRSTDTYSTK
ncbi:hypothetical protein CGRA01v4_02320 [Colletotrichum graminicola]|nr:hypothetical protein CGRA01v4_02320 [Colletotrichum graminicola]